MLPTRIDPLPPERIPVDPPQVPDHLDSMPFMGFDVMLKKVLGFVKGRASEFSTWIGAAIIAVTGYDNPDIIGSGIDLLVQAAGFLLMLLPDKAKVPTPDEPAG